MAGTTTRRRRWPAAVATAAAAFALGSVFGVPLVGRAAGQAAPANTATPTISGTPQEGSTLKASTGTWSGSPTSYAYAWSRCDRNGDGCAVIAGATGSTYTLGAADVDHALRVTVTAKNADGSGQATSAPTAVVSSAAAPTSTAPPTISGTVQVGSTLTASTGTWSGSPTGLAYAWKRCDANGASCAAIGGATGRTYQLGRVDAGTTLRVSVTATNGAGSTTATSVPTAVVPAPPAPVSNGCPSGSGTVEAALLSLPARLQIDEESVTPGVVTPSAGAIQVRARVTACGGRPVEGALLYATAVPYDQYSVPPEAATGADGVARVTMSQESGFPADRRQELLAVMLRARKPGDPLLGGISVRRLVSFPVSLR